MSTGAHPLPPLIPTITSTDDMIKSDGIASAASALRYWERRQEVAANNLANATTDGFKAERVFARLIGESLPAADAVTDRRSGTLRPTGQPLDLAIDGDGFFVVATSEGERWTRGGAFTLDPQGYLVDADGFRAAGERGPIRVTRDAQDREILPERIAIDRSGLVSVNGVGVDRLRVERGAPTGSLTHTSGMHYVPDEARSQVPLAERDVRQHTIEESNVNTVSTLVDLIAVQRNYAFAQKVLTTLDGVRSTITNDLGKATA
ncbi:MAG: Flagellar basal-body rod protein FlgF [Gemmatimonadaceae bacterium]|nr:Flagellar basal-body rod protein FlgF [Gemmatimonadaceae bacterium]